MQKSSESSIIAPCCPIGSWSKTRQISGLRRRAHSVSMSCCPIEVSKFKQSEAIPDNASNDGEQAGKTVRPLTAEGDEAKQHVKQHGGPKLPAYGMLGVTQKVADFEGLFDLLEEGFDAPAASIQIADTGSRPLEVVRQENHGNPFAVDLDPCLDSAQAPGILSAGLVSDQGDLVVADDIAFGSFQIFPVDPVAEIVLGPGNPENAASGQIEEVGKVNVGLVEDGDLAGLQPGAELHGAGIVMMGSFFDDGEGREESLQVQAKMHLRRRLTTSVLGPVHAVGHQGYRARIDGVNGFLESSGQSLVASRGSESRLDALEARKRRPKELFHQLGIPSRIGVAQSVSRRSLRPAQKAQPRKPKSGGVANVRQRNAVAELGEQKAHHVAPCAEASSELFLFEFPRDLGGRVRWYELAKLSEYAKLVPGWLFSFFHSPILGGIGGPAIFLSVI